MNNIEPQIILKPFNGEYRGACPFCGGGIAGDYIGLYIGPFLEGTDTPVCFECCEDRAPALAQLCDSAGAIENIRDFSRRKHLVSAELLERASEFAAAARAAHTANFLAHQIENPERETK